MPLRVHDDLTFDLRLCAALCAQVCKVYRFHTEDQRWLLVREQMSETPISFSLPKQLLSALIQEHRNRYAALTLNQSKRFLF